MTARERIVQLYDGHAFDDVDDTATSRVRTTARVQTEAPVDPAATQHANELDADRPATNTLKRLKRLRSTASLYEMGSSELELKANLYYHISNPLKRWKTDRSPPVMLMLQVAITIFVIAQVKWR